MDDLKPETLVKTLAVPTRAAMLSALMGGLSLPASELAYRAGISTSTASHHLNHLLKDGFVRVRKIGRHRYFELNGYETADVLERLNLIAPMVATGKKKGEASEGLKHARWCYDHLAGRLGVTIFKKLRTQRFIKTRSDDFELLDLTDNGNQFFSSMGINIEPLHNSRRKFAYECIDWSERKPHLAGALGAALAGEFVKRGWITEKSESRVVSITPKGQRWFSKNFDIQSL